MLIILPSWLICDCLICGVESGPVVGLLNDLLLHVIDGYFAAHHLAHKCSLVAQIYVVGIGQAQVHVAASEYLFVGLAHFAHVMMLTVDVDAD
ncbi:hypothetical protein BpHYR1_039699 [Brachionus plicatilis]|uniref:Secreted protein n=1 Tax=Brachionus plicatilis TaxID=10195 RepID=A0A3M7QDL8_BRAPC|nr:hypothetical protein BpHYR1_039699 [Brachionus plicatilis]